MAVISLLRNAWDPLANHLERLIRRVAGELPVDTDWTQSTKGSWYIHPRQHGAEMLLLSSTFMYASSYYLMRLFRPGSVTFSLLSTFVPPTPATLTEKALLASLVGSLGVTLTHKTIRRNKLFMLQPCHMSAALLILVMSFPNRTFSHILFNIYLHTQWGGLAALLFPDLRGHDLFGETFNFFAEHLLILIAPIYMMYSGRYLVLPPSPDLAMLSFSIYGFFHSPVLHACALRSGKNLNYLFAPPPMKFLIKLGPMYRIALYGTAMVAMFASRYLMVEGILSILPRKAITAFM